MDMIMKTFSNNEETVGTTLPKGSIESKRTALKSELKEDDIAFIKANTGFSTEKILKWFDDFKIQCPDLKLDKPKFIQFYKKLIPGDTDAETEFCGFIFEAFDNGLIIAKYFIKFSSFYISYSQFIDRNGYIDFGEFLIAFWIRCNTDLKSKLEWLFDLYDADNTNFISFWELYMMLRLLFIMKSIKEDPYDKTFYIMKLFDRSHDGNITKLEFVSACTTNEYLKKLFSPF